MQQLRHRGTGCGHSWVAVVWGLIGGRLGSVAGQFGGSLGSVEGQILTQIWVRSTCVCPETGPKPRNKGEQRPDLHSATLKQGDTARKQSSGCRLGCKRVSVGGQSGV